MEQGTSLFWDKTGMLVKRIIYIVCFVWLCYLDHIIGSATGYIQHALKNYTGVVIAIIILTAYRIKDFVKLPYLLWIILFFLGRYGILSWTQGVVYEYDKLEAALWNVGIYGIVLIRLFYAWKVEGRRRRMWKVAFGVWLAMMLGMVSIRPDVTWAGWFLLFFGCFYLTEFREADLNNLYSGMLEGIIIGFLLMQTCACMFRPYDMLRYEGMYSNANINALFYLLTYGAVLCKWYQMKLKRRPILLRLPVIALTGVLFGLTFLTMGRTALLSMLLLTVLFLVFQMISRKRGRLRMVLLDAGAVVLAVFLCFLPTYYVVRYLPAYVDEPLFFEADMNKLEKKIQQGEAIDSDKYTDLETVIEKSFGRLFWFREEVDATFHEWWSDRKLMVQAAGANALTLAEEGQVTVSAVGMSIGDGQSVSGLNSIKPGEDKTVPLLTAEEAEDPVKVRMEIYKYYIENTQWIGRREGTQDLWLTSSYSAPHAHNIFLHIAGEYGWIIGGLFLLMILLSYHNVLMGLVEKRQGKWYFRLFVTLIFTTVAVSFGMLEICWTFGQLPFTMLFLVQYMTFHRPAIGGDT